MSSDLACYTFAPPQTGPFSLVIPPTTYCAGSDVEGEVLLKFPQVQDEQIDEVIVELRGKLKVSVLVLHSGGQRVPSVERQELVFLKQSLWTRGSAYPPPDSHVLRLPFRFHLPSDPKILPSVCWDQAVITYYVEAIALRPRAFFTSDKRVRKGLAVVSRGDPTLCASIRPLGEVQAQGGPTWKTVHREKRVRRGIWGEHSTARVEVRLTFRLPPHGEMPVRPSPSLTAAPPSCTVPPQLLIPNQHGILPRCLDVPILIKIKTTTARLARAKADRHPEGKPIFPSLGLESDSNNNNSDSTVDVRMRQTFTVRVGGITDSRTTEIVLLHIKQHDLLPSSSSSSSYYLQWEDDVRAGDREMMGRWVQRWTLQPTVKLGRFPPTFECDSVDCAYTIRVEVPFPGMGNSIHVSMPVTLDSGIDQAMPIKGGGTRAARQRQRQATTASTDTSSGGGTEVPRDVEPPNLPPTYFDAVYRDGEVVSEGDGVRDTGTHPPRYNDQG